DRTLVVRSDLVGTAIELPAPLGKPAGTAIAFRLEVEMPTAGRPFSARLGDIVAVRGRLPGPATPFAARADFGATQAAPPPDAGLEIGGRAARVAAGEWLELAGTVAGSGTGLLSGVDLGIDELTFGRYATGTSRLRLHPTDTATEIRIDGEALAGPIVVPGAGRAADGIHGEFERIHLPADPDDRLADPGTDGGISPRGLPALHLGVADLRLGAASFGKARFDATPIPDGLRIERLEARSPGI